MRRDKPTTIMNAHGARSWQRWFPVVWVVFTNYPVMALLDRPRPTLEIVYGLSLLIAFALVFLWAFSRPHDERAYFETP